MSTLTLKYVKNGSLAENCSETAPNQIHKLAAWKITVRKMLPSVVQYVALQIKMPSTIHSI